MKPPKKWESKFVKMTMPNATPGEIEEATLRLRNVLMILDRMVTERDEKERQATAASSADETSSNKQ